jgi:ribosomal-protein-alanine N-acetyltransferase
LNNNILFKDFPVLVSDEIELAKVESDNLDDLFSIYSNERVFEYCGIIPKHNKETVKNMIGHFERDFNKKSRIKWGVFTKEPNKKLVGIIEVFDFNQKVSMVTIGYFLAEEYWGKGIATKAVRLLIHFLFDKAKVNRIQAEVMTSNEISKRVLLKNGFLMEGTVRQANLWSGKGIVDLEIYGLLQCEYNWNYV